MGQQGPSKKLYHPWAGPYNIVKQLSDTNYRIEQVQGRQRYKKVVHFDRLKLCPKNIHLDDKLTNEQHPSSQELITPTENSLPIIGHDLEIVDDDDDEADDATVTTPHTPMDTTSQAELAMPSGRYPR